MEYRRQVNKSLIPTCNILGVNIATVNMEWLVNYIENNLPLIKGDYICVANVHTTVTAYRDSKYKSVQNEALMAIPDGAPLSVVARKRGYREIQRTTGPDLMGEIFKKSSERCYRHFFYGSTEETLTKLKDNLEEDYPGINIVGLYSPPFRAITESENQAIINMINEAKPDFVWVGLGAPKQEIWMNEHQGIIDGLMIGVGAGFDYFANNIKRAPIWMQNLNLEWFYRLLQDPKRLFPRYFSTNTSYIWNAFILRKHDKQNRTSTDKKSVLIVHNYYKIPGGEDTVVANEKKMLEENGHKVYFYFRRNDELDTMSSIKIARKAVFNFSTFKEVRRLIKENKIDLVHVHNTLSLISPSVFYAARSMKVPVVQTIHNFRMLCPNALLYRDGHICEECINHGLGCAIKYACYHNNVFQTITIVLNMKIHRLTGIYSKINYICLTDFNKRKLLSMKQLDEKQVFVKPNLAKEVSAFRCKETKNQFIYVGRLDRYKGIRILLKAWKKYEEIGGTSKLIICGIGTEENWCKSFIKAHKTKQVIMKGFISNDDILQLISTSKALIMPTQLYEGFPMSIIEAYSVGTPVISSNIGNAGDLVTEGVTGFKFQYDSPDDLAKTLIQFEPSQINPDNIIRIYEQKYSALHNYEVLMQIYNNLK